MIWRENYLKGYFLQKNYDALVTASEVVVKRRKEGARLWGYGKLYQALGLINKTPTDVDGATAALEAVLAANITDKKTTSNVPLLAAYWRAHLAQVAGDEKKLEEMKALVKIKAPAGALKNSSRSASSEPGAKGLRPLRTRRGEQMSQV